MQILDKTFDEARWLSTDHKKEYKKHVARELIKLMYKRKAGFH